MIPKIIHQIWIGGKPIQRQALAYSEKIKALHSDWVYYLWDDNSVKRSGINLPEEYYKTANTGMKSDILRYAVLVHYGGIYLDMDIKIQKNLSPLINCDSFICENHPYTVSVKPEESLQNAVLGSSKNGKFFSYIFSSLRSWIKDPNKSKFLTTASDSCITVISGPVYLSIFHDRYVSLFGKDCILLPSHLFYPFSGFSPQEEKEREYPDSFGVHEWWGTWCQSLTK